MQGCPRRRFLALVVSATPLATLATAACQQTQPPTSTRPPEGMSQGHMPNWMTSPNGDGDMLRDMPMIRDLLTHHQDITRTVQDVHGGIRSTTTHPHHSRPATTRE